MKRDDDRLAAVEVVLFPRVQGSLADAVEVDVALQWQANTVTVTRPRRERFRNAAMRDKSYLSDDGSDELGGSSGRVWDCFFDHFLPGFPRTP